MVRWNGYHDGEQIIGGVDFEVAKNVLLDNLSLEADRALDHHDLETREAADHAWAILDGVYNQEFREDVNGVEYRLERSAGKS